MTNRKKVPKKLRRFSSHYMTGNKLFTCLGGSSQLGHTIVISWYCLLSLTVYITISNKTKYSNTLNIEISLIEANWNRPWLRLIVEKERLIVQKMTLIIQKDKRANQKAVYFILTPTKKMEMLYKRSRFLIVIILRYKQWDQRGHKLEGDLVRGVFLMKRFTCISQNTAINGEPDSTKLNKGLKFDRCLATLLHVIENGSIFQCWWSILQFCRTADQTERL